MNRSFKTALGRAGAGGRPVATAVAISGGPASAAVAALLGAYVRSLVPNARVPPARVVLVHVAGRGGDVVAEACRALEGPGVSLVVVRVEDAEVEELAAVRDLSDRAAFARAVVRRRVLEAAKAQGCHTVLFGTTATRVAVDVIERIVTGRGRAVAAAAAPAFQEKEGLMVVRPLKDIPLRLAVRYAQIVLPELAFTAYGALTVLIGPHSYRGGLYDVIERFIEEVEKDNASAVHNVARTASRLVIRDQNPVCKLCGEFCVPSCAPESKGCGACESCYCPSKNEEPKYLLCYSCSEALRRASAIDSSEEQNPVQLIIARSMRREKEVQSREAMRESIQEYLINDDDP